MTNLISNSFLGSSHRPSEQDQYHLPLDDDLCMLNKLKSVIKPLEFSFFKNLPETKCPKIIPKKTAT